MNKRSRALEKQDWLEESTSTPMRADPLSSIFERSRAERQGIPYAPETPASPLVVSGAPSLLPSAVASPDVSLTEFIAAANRSLSPSAFKVLLAVYVQGKGRYHAGDLARLTFLNKDTVNNAVQECLAKGWLSRRSECPQCGMEAVLEKGQKLIRCSRCKRTTSPQHHYSVQFPVENPVIPVGISATPNGNPVTHTVKTETPPQNSTTLRKGILATPDGNSVTSLTEFPLPLGTENSVTPDGNSAISFPLSRLRDNLRRSKGDGNPVTPPACADSDSVDRIAEKERR